MNKVIRLDGISYLPEAQAIITMKPAKDLFKEPESVTRVGRYDVVPWGNSNTLPTDVIDKISKSEVVSANLEFNILIGYGSGIKPMMKKDGVLSDCEDDRVLRFCEENDLQGYFIEQMTDLKTFYNVFPEIILSNDKTQIVSLRHKEAAFSRWGKIDNRTGLITKHFYSSKWAEVVLEKDVVITDVLDPYNPVQDLRKRIKAGDYKDLRFIIPVNFSTPGKTYYQYPYWWTIFQSGWYDFSSMVPEVKKALLKNRFGVKYIIYISPKYFKSIFKEEGIDPTDVEAVRSRVDKEHQFFSDFLTGSENAGKGLVAIKEMIQSQLGVTTEKYIEIEEVKVNHDKAELVDDSEEVSNIISYAMGVHPSLIGSAPGKTGGSMSGTDKRELFMIKQALMKPFRDRLLRPLYAIKQFNGWPKELVWVVPDILFTSLDQNKSGQETKITQ
jgi:hypothetical protein